MYIGDALLVVVLLGAGFATGWYACRAWHRYEDL